MTAATQPPPGAADHGHGTSSRPAGQQDDPVGRRLYRSAEGRMLGGVARGLAGHLGLPVSWVRLVFLALFVVDGLGAIVYAAFWFVVPLGVGGVGVGVARRVSEPAARTGPDGLRGFTRRPDKGQILALLALVVGLGVYVNNLDFGGPFSLHLLPLLLIGAGVALVWRQADDARRARWTAVGRSKHLLPVARTAAGVVLVGAGVSGIVVLQGSARHLGSALQAALAVLVGIALLAGPYVVRMTQDLHTERLARIRAQERAEVAAHVHDSVLHTLTLIQRNASDAREVARLARAQERELRAWLHRPQGAATGADAGDGDGPGTLAEAVRATAAEVEDHHGVPVEVVCVGDCPLEERLAAQVQAAREAMVNAAKYGGEDGPVQVYAEVEGRTVFVSVRDHGPGFDPDAVPADRMGVRESIVGRMQRNGGTAHLRSAPDGGTVVELETDRMTERSS
ncbi:ATP-binding protein [Streptomyces meridianus]|uniref:PspC domain-containing protein n=1 Tax=Streptomyces meridianus TaxID=2938945 RepID=A0ABT0X526_9ACTN|nr:ATP-binding protein [Streptomyces meridianus]MCM2577642.1 PspC domain-containing protein [Streptomyces meridianus]